MYEEFKCVTNVTTSQDIRFTVEYYLITEDDLNFGIKTIVYTNGSLHSTDLFQLSLSNEKAEELIDMFCTKHVFPESIPDIVQDLECTV